MGIFTSTRIRTACFGLFLLTLLLAVFPKLWAQYPSGPQVTKNGTGVLLQDYASVPLASPVMDTYPPPIDYYVQLGRINALRSEPADAPESSSRFFVNDASSILYILDKSTKKFTPYIDFAEVFPKFSSARGNSTGFISFAFDPEYAKNGKFYTVHSEYLGKNAPSTPTNAHLPGLNLDGYQVTDPVNPPGGHVCCESIVVEWTDKNIRDDKFEGTAREILRVGFSFTRHQMGDLVFDPLAKPGSSDYRNLYLSLGDGGAGEVAGVTHSFPQQLNALPGKILRITPEISLRPADLLSSNGRYRIPSTGPDPNPFVTVGGARPEIFAYGFRNPHRLFWDAPTNTLLANDIGLHLWEEIDIVHKGGNYGYPEREGNEQLFVGGPNNGKTGSLTSPPSAFPVPDVLTVEGLKDPVSPIYPAAIYSHQDGDAIGSGGVYRGKLMPQLVGKYIFNDMTTGRLFYADLNEMLATKGQRNKQAAVHELQVLYKSPYAASEQDAVKRRMYDIVADEYAHKEGKPQPKSAGSDSKLGVLPGFAMNPGGWQAETFVPGTQREDGVPYGGGRADVRVLIGGDGEVYVLSKSDGMIRKMVSVMNAGAASQAHK